MPFLLCYFSCLISDILWLLIGNYIPCLFEVIIGCCGGDLESVCSELGTSLWCIETVIHRTHTVTCHTHTVSMPHPPGHMYFSHSHMCYSQSHATPTQPHMPTQMVSWVCSLLSATSLLLTTERQSHVRWFVAECLNSACETGRKVVAPQSDWEWAIQWNLVKNGNRRIWISVTYLLVVECL